MNLKTLFYKSIFLLPLLFLASCGQQAGPDEEYLKTADWQEITKEATGKTVNFMMWQGSPLINEYINNYVVPTVKERFDINLRISGGQGPEIVQLVMGEKQADIGRGEVDMVWINGETFFQLRKIDGLWGPFVSQLPNSKYIDFDDPYINTDFQQAVNGMEAPWSIGQFAMVHDKAKVPEPPKDLTGLEIYVREYPGTFTISNDFTGMTLLKSFLAELGGGPNSLDGPFDEEKYQRLSSALWNYINRNKLFFWKSGATFPKEHSRMNQLFATGELHIIYGFNEGGVEEKVQSGLYPETTRVYPWENGTIKNANYLGILHNAPEKAAALQVINFLLSPEAQLEKARVDGMNANTVLDIDKLPQEWQEKFKTQTGREYGMESKELEEYAIQEPAPEYMIRLYDDFRKYVIEK